jgi:hypothetical protein
VADVLPTPILSHGRGLKDPAQNGPFEPCLEIFVIIVTAVFQFSTEMLKASNQPGRSFVALSNDQLRNGGDSGFSIHRPLPLIDTILSCGRRIRSICAASA